MPSHIYFFDRHAPPAWNEEYTSPTDAVSIAARERLISALLHALPGASQQLIDQDDQPRRWESAHITPLSITVWHDHVHVRIPYWTAHELRRRAADLNLGAVADVVSDIAGYDCIHHSDQPRTDDIDIYSIIDRIGEIGDEHFARLTQRLDDEPATGAFFPVEWMAT